MSWQDAVTLASKFVDNGRMASYVRGAVAALFAMLIAKAPFVGHYLDPAVQDAVAVAVATVVVGVWGHVVKDAADAQVKQAVAQAKVEGQIEGATAAVGANPFVVNNPTPTADPTPVIVVTKDPAP
jgi:hypothetical protein